MDRDFLLIIDGSSLLTTQFFGNLPREILFAKTMEEKERYFHKIMKTANGVYTNAVYGFLKALFKIVSEQKPTHLAVTWDMTRDTFRRRMYPPYKGTRQETMAPLSEQFGLMQRVLSELNIAQFMSEDYEADDYSGSLARRFEAFLPVKILTKDHDYLQLVNDHTHLWLQFSTKEKSDELFKKYKVPQDSSVPEKCFELTPETVRAEFGVSPSEIASLKGLQGDSSDNIPGVPGIGPKTAVSLIRCYHDVDTLYRTISALTPEKENALKAYWKENFGITRSPIAYLLKQGDPGVTEENGGCGLSAEASARLSEELARIKTDIDLHDTNLSDLLLNISGDGVRKVLLELEISTISADFTAEDEEDAAEEQIVEKNGFFALKEAETLFDGEKTLGAYYVPDDGLYLAKTNRQVVKIPESGFITKESFGDFLRTLTDKGIRIFVRDGKFFYKKMRVKLYDVTIAAYLLNPLLSAYPLSYLISEYTDLKLKNKEDGASAYSEALAALFSGIKLLEKLEEAGMAELYAGIELGTMVCLAEMEEAGILVKEEALREFSAELQRAISTLEEEIHALSGVTFNVNSPKRLAEVLFDEMKIPYPYKKARKSYSTGAEILEKLKKDHPIAGKVLEYRAYTKLRGTYTEGLRAFISADGRIYGTFNQTVTATGRISSANPNLQNIPVRTELGRKIRKLFVPKEGSVFVDADYSQIELRVLAHMSGDRGLIDAYNAGLDIHRMTASQVFHIPYDAVTATERSRAKAVNFGIVYGISAYSLSEDIGVSPEEAEAYMKKYFEAFPGIARYQKETVAFAKEHGFVKTLYGRIRPIPELVSSNYNERMFAERAAMNSPIQGTAADIMKMAVIRVNEALKKAKMQSRIVLQVHDEIIIEAPLAEADAVEALLVREMEQAAELKVKLVAEASRGESWYETK